MLPQDRDFYVEILASTSSEGMTKSHIHDYYEIFYLLDGHRRYFINHTILDVLPHDIILVNKGDVHMAQFMEENLKYARHLITFNDSFLDSFGEAFDQELMLKAFYQKKVHIPDSQHNLFNKFLIKAEENISKKNIYAQYTAKAYTLQFLVGLNKLAEHSKTPTDEEITIYEERIQEVCRYMFNFYNQPITLEQMAKIAYMSPTYFSKRFKSVTGFGFREYLNNIRIKMATELLMETQYSITEIASYCGYHDSNYFGDVFKRVIGSSPNKYRKDHYMV